MNICSWVSTLSLGAALVLFCWTLAEALLEMQEARQVVPGQQMALGPLVAGLGGPGGLPPAQGLLEGQPLLEGGVPARPEGVPGAGGVDHAVDGEGGRVDGAFVP